MNLEHLRTFLVVVDEGSMSRASSRLFIAQTAVGRQVRLLEEAFAIELLVRSSSGVTPTQAGQELVAHAQKIFDLVSQAESAIGTLSETPSGPVSVAIPTSLVDQLAMPLFREVRQTHPHIQIELMEGDSNAIAAWIADERIHLGLLPDDAGDIGLNSTPCGVQIFCFCHHKDAFPALKSTLTLQEALSYPLVLTVYPNRLRRAIEKAALAQGLQVEPVATAGTSHLVDLLVQSGDVATIRPFMGKLPCVVGNLRYVPIVDPTIKRGINLIWSRARKLSPASFAVKRIMLELMSSDDLLTPATARASTV